MRFLRLALLAFGPFTDKILDFDRGQDGIHLIHGANEAGKSASLRALISFLYGIPARSRDNFIHPHPDLRVGARLRLSNGSTVDCIRRKGNKNTLIHPDGHPLPDTLLEPYLGRIDQPLFTSMYGLDQATLAHGGNDLVTGQGDIGESLFAAGSGVSGMRRILSSLEADADDLFKPRGKNQPINQLAAELKDLQKQFRERSLSSAEWKRHDRNHSAAMKDKAAVLEELTRASSERNRLGRLQKAIPLTTVLLDLRSEQNRLGDAVILPPEFADRRRAAEDSLAHTRARRTRDQEELTVIEKQIGDLSPPDNLLRAQEDISQLFQRSGEHKKAQLDLPRRRADHHRLQDDAQTILKRLGPQFTLETAEALRLTDAQVARIQKLGREQEPLEEKVRTLRSEKATLDSELTISRQRLAQTPPVPETEPLENACRRARRQGDLEERWQTAMEETHNRRNDVAVKLAHLGLWDGPADMLETLSVPSPETVRRFETAFAATEKHQDQIAGDIAAREQMIRELNGRIREMEASGSVPKEIELDQARRHRDRGWRLVRRAWLDETLDINEITAFVPSQAGGTDSAALAEAFTESIRRADEVGDHLRTESERVAQLAGFSAQLETHEKELTALNKEKAALENAHAVLKAEWNTCWENLSIKPLPPKEMEAWLQNHRRLCDIIADLRGRSAEAKRLGDLTAAHREEVNACLIALGHLASSQGESLESLIERGESVCAAAREALKRRETMQAAVVSLEERLSLSTEDLAATEAAQIAWRMHWTEAIRPLGLDTNALPEEVDAVLALIQELFKRLEKAQDMMGRIRAIEADSDKFSAETTRLCARLFSDLGALAPEEAVSVMNERLQSALVDAARLEELGKRKRSLTREIRSVQSTIDQAQIALDGMCRAAGAESVKNLPEIEQRSAEMRQLKEKILQTEEELSRYSAGMRLAEFIEEAGRTDFDSLPAAVAALDDKIQHLEDRRSELDQLIGSEQTALAMMDGRGDAAALAERSQEILAEMKEKAEAFARFRIAAILLQREIERYREANQGPILQRAGEIFRRLTVDSFSGVVPEYDEKDTPVLVGLRPSGEKVEVAGMSDGTCDQLYLALRLASIEQRLAQAEPMPLILDDILVNFDDRRARATLEVLAELSSKTQVIFFTHHRHLVQIAESVLDRDILFNYALGDPPIGPSSPTGN